MDPISAIVAALAAGAIAATKDTATAAIKDGYQALKSLIRKKLSTEPEAQAVVDANAVESKNGETVLRTALARANVDQDGQAIAAAKDLLIVADPDGEIRRRFTIQVHGDVQGLVQGDHANVTMNFGDPKR